MQKIKKIDGVLLDAILKGAQIKDIRSRQNKETGFYSYVVLVEIPKGVIVDFGEYWRFVVYKLIPNDSPDWYLSTMSNETLKTNIKSMVKHWQSLRYL